MKNIVLLFSIAFVVFLSACSTNPKVIKDLHDKEVSINTIYPSETAISNPDLKYAYYLPSAYNGKTKIPVIYLLDPHANGAYPLSLYSEIADKQNVILVASNNIKNGMKQTDNQAYFSALMEEVNQRFLIDKKQQFVGGFSGGAKLAILFASQMKEIIGAIACGGTIPFTPDYIPNFYFAGIIGSQDFSYLEMYKTQNTFSINNFDFTSIKFNGGHVWPPIESFDLAVSGLKLYGIKMKLSKNNNAWVDALFNQLSDSVTRYNQTNQSIKEFEALKQMERWFYNVKPITQLQQRSFQLENNRDFKNQVVKIQSYSRTEISLRTEYIKAIEKQDLDWWKIEAEKLTNTSLKNQEARDINYRLKNYVSMICFMLIRNDLDYNTQNKALKKLQVYELIDASNPDVYLMWARYYLQNNQNNEMVESIEKAKQLPTFNEQNYQNNPSWEQLFSNPLVIGIL